MQHKDNKNIGFKAGNADKNFTEELLMCPRYSWDYHEYLGHETF